MKTLLKNRTALIAVAVLVLLGLKLVPSQLGFDPGSLSPGQAPSSASSGGDVKGSRQAKPTAQPATIDPQRVGDRSHPFLVLRAAEVTQGAPVVVGGQSFQPNQELAFSLRPGGNSAPIDLGTAIADKYGFLQDISLPLPEGLKSGTYKVVATPTLGGPSVEATLRVGSSQSWGRLTGATAKPGETAGFEGGGFKPGEQVSVHLDNLGGPALATVEASVQGGVSGTFSVPLADEGGHVILFYGDQSRMPTLADLNIQGFHPWVVLDNYSPAPEQPVGFAGSDFTPGESVYIFFNSVESRPAAVVQVGPDGTFKAPGALKLAPEVKGEQKLFFVGDHSQIAAEADFTVLPYPASLQLTVYAGPPGSEVAFLGTGFARGEEVDAYAGQPGSGQKLSSFKADAKGNFAGAGVFRVPRDAKAGDLTLSVLGQVSGAEATVSFSVLPISAWAEAKPDKSGKVVVLGHGFAPGEAVDLTVSQAGDKPLATTSVDKNGNAEFAPLDIKAPGSGKPASIEVKGRESGGEAKADYYGGGAGENGAQSGNENRGSLEFKPSGTPGAAPAATPGAAPVETATPARPATTPGPKPTP